MCTRRAEATLHTEPAHVAGLFVHVGPTKQPLAHPQAADVAEVVILILQQLQRRLLGTRRLLPAAPAGSAAAIPRRQQGQTLQVAADGCVRVLCRAVVLAACTGSEKGQRGGERRMLVEGWAVIDEQGEGNSPSESQAGGTPNPAGPPKQSVGQAAAHLPHPQMRCSPAACSCPPPRCRPPGRARWPSVPHACSVRGRAEALDGSK